jgi:hypothetical protein
MNLLTFLLLSKADGEPEAHSNTRTSFTSDAFVFSESRQIRGSTDEQGCSLFSESHQIRGSRDEQGCSLFSESHQIRGSTDEQGCSLFSESSRSEAVGMNRDVLCLVSPPDQRQ